MVCILFKFLMPMPRFEPGTPDHDLFVPNDEIRSIDELDRSAMGLDCKKTFSFLVLYNKKIKSKFFLSTLSLISTSGLQAGFVQILNLYIILLYTHLYHFLSVSIDSSSSVNRVNNSLVVPQ